MYCYSIVLALIDGELICMTCPEAKSTVNENNNGSKYFYQNFTSLLLYTPTQHTSLSKLVVIKITSYALSFELHV